MKYAKRRVFTLILLLAVVAGCAVLMTICNKTVLDTKYKFSWAYVLLPDGDVVTGPVDSWTDFGDGDQLQVTIKGVTYLSHGANIVLCSEKP